MSPHPLGLGLRLHAYRCVAIDFPWLFSAGTKGRPQHYARMTDSEIAAVPIADLAHPSGCFFFIWTTSPLAERFWLRIWPAWRAQGLRYSARAFVWVKTKPDGSPAVGQGLTTRKSAEDVLLFKIGAPKRVAADVNETILSPRREHSRKPDEFYRRAERFCRGPRADIFSREKRSGWDTYGWQDGKFDPAG